MSAATSFDVVLALAILGAAVFAVFGRPRIHAVVMFLVFGVLLAVSWARLGAPDVAIAEAVLGAGVTGALMMAAVTAGPSTAGQRATRPWVPIAAGVLAALVALALALVALVLPVADGVDAHVQENLQAAGVEHPVTAVLLNFRSYDTLLEVAVLAVAVLGVLTLWGDGRYPPGFTARPRDAGPLGAMVRLLTPVLVLVIGWLLVAGSTRPGGAFQAGALLAGGVVMIYLAGLGWATWVVRWLPVLLLAGLGAFLMLAFGSAGLHSGWLVLDQSWAGAVIVAVEAALTVSIGLTLGALFVSTQEEHTAREPDRGA